MTIPMGFKHQDTWVTTISVELTFQVVLPETSTKMQRMSMPESDGPATVGRRSHRKASEETSLKYSRRFGGGKEEDYGPGWPEASWNLHIGVYVKHEGQLDWSQTEQRQELPEHPHGSPCSRQRELQAIMPQTSSVRRK